MKIKTIYLLSSSILIPMASSIIFTSCSSTIDQNFVDKFYSSIVEKTNWAGNNNEYASSIYNLRTFRLVFKDQLPTNEELQSKGLMMTLENIVPYDQLGISNYTVYLRDKKTLKTYLPTPRKINDDSDKKEVITSFSIEGFLKSNDSINTEFDNAYNLVLEKYPLTTNGNNFFKTQNIEENISFDNPASPYYLGKLFSFKEIPNFEISSFEKVMVDDKNKIVEFKIYLMKDSKAKGPGKLVTLSL